MYVNKKILEIMSLVVWGAGKVCMREVAHICITTYTCLLHVPIILPLALWDFCPMPFYTLPFPLVSTQMFCDIQSKEFFETSYGGGNPDPEGQICTHS